MRTIYTVGYGRLDGLRLRQLAFALDVTVVDVRAKATSRWQPDFTKANLTRLLAPSPVVGPVSRYVHRPDLGGEGHGVDSRTWPIREMLGAVARPMLMCMEHAPGSCHRHEIALAARKLFPRLRIVHLMLGRLRPDAAGLREPNEAIDAVELQRAIDAEDDYECEHFEAAGDLVELEARRAR